MLLAAAATSAGSDLTAYGPIVVATAGLITALVAAMSRKDKRVVDVSTTLDARTNTAIKGLEAYADRLEEERARWQERAEKAESRAEELEARLEVCEREHPQRRAKPPREG